LNSGEIILIPFVLSLSKFLKIKIFLSLWSLHFLIQLYYSFDMTFVGCCVSNKKSKINL
jgi:hypothetical protein